MPVRGQAIVSNKPGRIFSPTAAETPESGKAGLSKTPPRLAEALVGVPIALVEVEVVLDERSFDTHPRIC